MPIPEKYSHEKIVELYEQWKKSNLPLKDWVKDYNIHHHPPLNYVTIFKRFKKLEKITETQRPTLDIIEKTVSKNMEKYIAKEVSLQAKSMHDFYYNIGKTYLSTFIEILEKTLETYYKEISRKITFECQIMAKSKGLNPEHLTQQYVLQTIDKNPDYFFEKFKPELLAITSLKYHLYYLKHGNFPTSLEQLIET